MKVNNPTRKSGRIICVYRETDIWYNDSEEKKRFVYFVQNHNINSETKTGLIFKLFENILVFASLTTQEVYTENMDSTWTKCDTDFNYKIILHEESIFIHASIIINERFLKKTISEGKYKFVFLFKKDSTLIKELESENIALE